MRCRKTVTEKKVAANRRNAHLSTGPRTQRGKHASRFNAVKTGLFAKHVVIPIVDGDDSKEQFPRLLADLQREFQPEGPAEEFYVAEMAKSMWRVRRATRCEKGSVRNVAVWAGGPTNTWGLAEPHIKASDLLKKAKEEISATKTLSPTRYTAILPLLQMEEPGSMYAEKVYNPAKVEIDDHFVSQLNWIIDVHCQASGRFLASTDEREEDYYAGHALPPEIIMNQILRYEKAAQNKFDWALEKLVESQERRRNAHASLNVEVTSD